MMKKKSLILILTFVFPFLFSQVERKTKIKTPTSETLKTGAFIDINDASYAQTNYTIAQLITNVLINGGSNCSVNISNVVVSPNLLASNPNRSWGYFNKGTTTFPFSDGVLLMTGRASSAGNTFLPNTLSGSLGTTSDADLAAALGVNSFNLFDSTYIQFDFVPVTSQISFNYIFASEEYSSVYPCTYTDGFALLLKKVTDPNYINLAVLPGGAGPVSVTNIHPANNSCGAVNQQYYAGNNTTNTETNFSGRTIPLTASATVIPGQTYRFKIVLADFSPSTSPDTSYDTGVFLKAGSFNIGVQLVDGAGVTLPSNISLCQGSSQLLNATSTVAGATYQWFLNGVAIPGATSGIYSATQTGTYSVQVLVPGSTCPGTAQIAINFLPLPVVQNSSLSECSTNSTATFNLTTAQPNISTTTGATFSYYLSQADAIAGNTNTIANPSAYTSGNATIYVLVKSGTCSNIAQLQLNVMAIPITPTITASSTTICNGGTVTLTSSTTTGNTWSNGQTTQSITINAAGTYTLTNTNSTCTSSPASIIINDEVNPNLQITGNLVFCQNSSTTLTATSTGTGNTYLWSNGQTTPAITVNSGGNYSVTLTTPAGCQYQQSVTVTANTPPNAQNSSLSQCSSGSTANFDLTSAQPTITLVTGCTFSYYVNQADAIAGNANTIANPTAYNSGNATIYVLVKNGTCSQVVQLQLSVVTTLTPTITASNTTICANTPVTLTSNFATGNSWSTGATTQSISVSTAGTYTLSIINGSCTSTPASVTITSTPNPNVQISGNLVLCSSPSTVLTATASGAGNTFSWSNGVNGATNTITTPGTYTVTVTTPTGCTFQNSATVIAGTVPVVQNAALNQCSLTNTATFNLTSAQPNISTTAGVTFSYYANQADAIAGNTNTIANPTAYNSGNATIYVLVSTSTCSKIAQLQLTVTLIPTPTITQSAPAICAGNPVTLNSNYPTGNSWSNGATTQSITVTNAGTYTLLVTNGSCVGTPASVTLVSTPNPNLQVTGNLSFCQGTTTVLTATANGTGNTFAWSNGSNTASTTVNAAGNYTVTVTTLSGCTFQKTVTVTEEPTITINIAQPGQITCTTPTTIINASGSIFQAGATILWTASGGGNIVSGANTLTPTVNSGGNYTLTITNATGLHCSQQATITVIQNNTPPIISVTAPQLTICAGNSITLTASGAQTYTWTGLTGNGNTQTVSPTTTTTYTVTGVGANGCQGNTTSITINVVPAIVSAIKDIQFCKGESGILDAGSGPNYTYLWNNGQTTQTISVTLEGIYTVTINNGVCSKTFSATVSYTPVPVLQEVIYDNNTLTLLVQQPNPNLEYSINGGVTWQNSNVFTNILQNINITIFVRLKGYTCYSVAEYYTFYVQNAITPNSDGINDEIDFSGVSQYKNFSASIYDRYGKELFKATANKTKWTGNYVNAKVPTGTYWYQVTWIDPISLKPILRSGWILLKNRE